MKVNLVRDVEKNNNFLSRQRAVIINIRSVKGMLEKAITDSMRLRNTIKGLFVGNFIMFNYII